MLVDISADSIFYGFTTALLTNRQPSAIPLSNRVPGLRNEYHLHIELDSRPELGSRLDGLR
jgi:hypothetical protein